MKKVAILQSNYIPWKGYFDLINIVDEFILFDDVQFTKRDWRNRNQIKTPNGKQWLSIPVEVKGKYFQTIRETKISDFNWKMNHWKSIQINYSKAKCFQEFGPIFEELFCNCTFQFISEINYYFITAINNLLGIQTKISWSTEYNLIDGKTERLVDLCLQAGATEYISGPAAKDYIDKSLFDQQNIKLSWIDYSGYPEYNQLYPPFEHGVSIIDLILNEGKNAISKMKNINKISKC